MYWRSVESLPRDKDGMVRLDYDALGSFIDRVYRQDIDRTRKAHPYGVPQAIVDLMDEPAGAAFGGPEYEQSFRLFCRENRLTSDFFGKASWEQVKPPRFNWWTYFKDRAAIDCSDLHARRLWYWVLRHWDHATARMYALATRKVQQYAGDVAIGTRVNFGPPWFYDYGTLPRGIDIFEFGKLKGVTLGFNEDWIGLGSPRLPLEINTLLMDWSRAAARPDEPLMGCYITRDADRAAVKLRTFACLARNAKVFDFYYYGPTYTHFDPWSDNSSMVQGVGELLRDIGQVDDILWEARPPNAEVAILYSKSWPVWKEDDTEQVEQTMAYLALLHAGIPVDIVSDEQVVDGWLDKGKYKALYVVNESIPAAALAAIEKWVEGGGHLWASGWAGMKDEYNTPTDAWDKMLGEKERSWKVTGDTKRLGQVLQPADWMRPVFVAGDDDDDSSDRQNNAGTACQTRTRHCGGRVRDGRQRVPGCRQDCQRERWGKPSFMPDDQKRGVYADICDRRGRAATGGHVRRSVACLAAVDQGQGCGIAGQLHRPAAAWRRGQVHVAYRGQQAPLDPQGRAEVRQRRTGDQGNAAGRERDRHPDSRVMKATVMRILPFCFIVLAAVGCAPLAADEPRSIPACMVIDDPAPFINMRWVKDKSVCREIPTSFYRELGQWAERAGVKGKFSVIPCLGGIKPIDGSLGEYTDHSRDERLEWIAMVKALFAPRFTITPEVITHWHVWDVANHKLLPGPQTENQWLPLQPLETQTQYIAAAMKMLRDAGLEPGGLTMCWSQPSGRLRVDRHGRQADRAGRDPDLREDCGTDRVEGARRGRLLFQVQRLWGGDGIHSRQGPAGRLCAGRPPRLHTAQVHLVLCPEGYGRNSVLCRVPGGKLGVCDPSGRWIESDGRPHVGPERELLAFKTGSYCIIPVPKGMDGAMWKFVLYQWGLNVRFFNIPTILSLTSDGPIVPEEVAKKDGLY